MPRVRRAHGRGKADGIAHFTEHDDVRVLPQDIFERVMKRLRVQSDFALFNDTLVVFKNKFNRVFERDDVLFEIAVDVLDHRRKRGGLAATGRPGHQHDAARGFRDQFDLLEQTQLFKAGHVGFDVSHRQRPLAALLEQIGPKTPQAGDEIGEINFAVLFQTLFQMVRGDGRDNFIHPFRRRKRTFNRDQFAVDAENHWRADFQMHIRRAAINGYLENFLKEFHATTLTNNPLYASQENSPGFPSFFRVFCGFRG